MRAMYVGIDVGGTKTLVASLSDDGKILHHEKFPTPQSYKEFLDTLEATIEGLPEHDFKAGGIGVPAQLDRENGVGEAFPNLPQWQNVPVLRDVEAITVCPMVIENDAKMGALAEALLHPEAPNVLYVAFGTGIGWATVIDGEINTNAGDGGGNSLLIEHNGELVPWESFASGHAIFERYGMKASEIEDEETWQKIAYDMSLGLVELIATTEPDLIVLGGGIGTHYKKYDKFLSAFLDGFATSSTLLDIPPIQSARRPEEAVVYGCYDLAKQRYGTAASGA